MPLFDPDTELDFGDDFDFDEHDPVDGYASADGLGLGFSVDGVQVPFRTVSQHERTEPQSIFPESPRHGGDGISTSGASRSEAAQQQRGRVSSNNHGRENYNENMSPAKRNAAVGTKKSFGDDSGSDWNHSPPHQRRRLSKTPSKGGKNGGGDEDEEDEEHAESDDDDESKDSGEEEQGDEEAEDDEADEDEEKLDEEKVTCEDGQVVQKVHHDRWEPDFGKIRPKISEAMLSFIRDGYEALKDTEVVCFKPDGGAFKASTRKQKKKKGDEKASDQKDEKVEKKNQKGNDEKSEDKEAPTPKKKKVGSGQVWVTNDEAFFKDAVTWAIGGHLGTSNHDPAFRDSYQGARQERNEELTKWLDSARYAGNMDAARMAANRKARRQAVENLLAQYKRKGQKATISQAKEVINAIAGKTVDYEELKNRIKDPEKNGYEFGPLPAALQVDPIYSSAKEQTQEFRDKKVKEYDDWKLEADRARKAARDPKGGATHGTKGGAK